MHYALSPVPRHREQEARALGADDVNKLGLWDKPDHEASIFPNHQQCACSMISPVLRGSFGRFLTPWQT